MKKLFFNQNKILAGCLLIAINTLVSCKKLVELPGNPPNQITRTEQFADSASTLSVVAGVYTYNTTTGFPYSNATLTVTTALSAHEISSTQSSGDRSQFFSYTLIPSNTGVASLWTHSYESLYQVNDVLSGITNNNNLSASFIKQVTGEMELTRALFYFNLVNLFGGVPLVTSTDYATTAQLPRASVGTIYAQVLTDLNDAVKKLPASYPSAGRARPNLYTALALLSKVHLYQKNWQAAYNEADSVIRLGGYSLVPTLNNVFLDGSQEAIWQLPVTSSYNGTQEAVSFIPFFSFQTPNYVVTDSLLNQFETGDQRLTNWLHKSVVRGSNVYYPFKYKNVQLTTTSVEDYMVFRLGEMYLVRAEAAAELNNLTGALADVNIIRARAGLAASRANAASQDAVLSAVAKEKRIELCFEWGNRWYDLNRTGQAAAVLPGYQGYDALYPIPQSQLQFNSHLIQNPGYH